MIEYADFERVDMRVGRIVAVEDFPEARRPAWKLRIDFGSQIGERRSSAQITNYLDALIVKIRDGNTVRNHACYLAIGVNLDGERDVLGIWFQKTEGAKFWLQVLTDLKQRGVADVLICCVDGLTGFPDAIEAVFPQAWVQTCIVQYADLRVMPTRGRRACNRAGRVRVRSA